MALVVPDEMSSGLKYLAIYGKTMEVPRGTGWEILLIMVLLFTFTVSFISS